MDKQLTVIMYFIYGLAFYSMGLSSLFQYLKQSNFLFRKSLLFLAWFGIIHGMTEWLIMFNRTLIFSQYQVYLFFAIMFLYGLSFFSLIYFAFHLLEETGSSVKKYSRFVSTWFIFWLLMIVIVITTNEFDLTNVQDELRLLTRYLTALPAGMLTVYALIKYRKKILMAGFGRSASLLQGLAITFFFYTIFTGLIGEPFGFFPANIINSENFYRWTGIPIEIFRIVSAIIITVVMFLIISDFELESEIKRQRNQTASVRTIERKRMGSQLHDIVLQKLFSVGMTLDSLLQSSKDEDKERILEIKDTTSEIMNDIRDYLRSPIIQYVDIDDFQAELTLLLDTYRDQIRHLEFNFNIPLILAGRLDASRLNDIIYIVREFTLNTIRHAKAAILQIDVSSNRQMILILMKDDGVGFDITDINLDKHFGITSIKSRVARCGGEVMFKKVKKGTECMISIPWSQVNAHEHH